MVSRPKDGQDQFSACFFRTIEHSQVAFARFFLDVSLLLTASWWLPSRRVLASGLSSDSPPASHSVPDEHSALPWPPP